MILLCYLKGFIVKKFLSIIGLASLGLVTSASAAFTAPDLSATVTDMGVAFGAVLTLVVAFIGFKYIKRMFT